MEHTTPTPEPTITKHEDGSFTVTFPSNTTYVAPEGYRVTGGEMGGGIIVEHYEQASDPTAFEPLRSVVRMHARAYDAQRRLARAVQEAHAAGSSWEQIGAVLGITRQAASRRYGQRPAY